MIKKHILLFSMLVFIFSCAEDHTLKKEYAHSLSVQLTTANHSLNSVVNISVVDIINKYPDFNPKSFVFVQNEKETASQAVDLDADGSIDEIAFVYAGGPLQILYNPQGEKKREYTKQAYAEISHKINGEFVKREYIGGVFKNTDFLKVPPEHTDHSWFIRYEGPGWESNKVGYRFYMDWRNAVDIYGKKTPEMVLHNVGTDGFDSYHEMSDWGMDILKVGGSLGLGSIGFWQDQKAIRVEKTDSIQCRIVAAGPIQAIIKTDYFGWKIDGKSLDLTSILTINANSRLTKCELILSEELSNLCSGIVKHDSATVIPAKNESSWHYLATYGKQSLNDDKLGMAVLYQKDNFIETAEDKESHVVILHPSNKKLTYYFLAAWELEPQGITTRSQFMDYLEDTQDMLNQDMSVIIN